MKYKVMAMDVPKDSLVEFKEGEIPLNTFFDAASGKWKLACLLPVEEKEEEEE